MAADERQPQHVIFHMINGRQEVCFRHLTSLCVSDCRIDVITTAAPPKLINCAALGRCHQPSAGIAWDAVGWPLRQCCDQRILRHVFSKPDVSYDPDRPAISRFDL
jgi:hypothetical protein